MPQIEMLVIGSVSRDIRIFVDSFPPLHCEAAINRKMEFPGGAGTYFSIFSALFGFKTSLVSKVGGDAEGKQILNSLNRHRINTLHVSVIEDVPTRVLYFIYDKKFRRRLLVCQDKQLEMTEEDLKSDFLGNCDFIHVGPVTFKALKKAALFAVKHKKHLVLNPSAIFVGYTLDKLRSVLRAAEIFFVNDAEIRLYSGETDIIKGCRKIAKYMRGLIIVTKGACGCLVYDPVNHNFFHVPGIPVKVTDPTGAGDAFAAGFLYEYLRTRNPCVAARFANATAATLVSTHNVLDNTPTMSKIKQLVRFYE